MLTLFTCPKPFTNPHIRQIQRNAIGSWIQLKLRPEILLLGDEEGIADVAVEFGVRHIPELAFNEFGTPLVDSIFSKAQAAAHYDIRCYINADIILTSDFITAIQQIRNLKENFLIIGQRHDLDLNQELSFTEGWETELKKAVQTRGVLHAITGIDYFIFRKGTFDQVKPFALGRTAWDNWLVYHASIQGIAVIDATQAIIAVHQNHDYSHMKWDNAWKNIEAKKNYILAGNTHHTIFNIGEAVLKFNNKQLHKNHPLTRLHVALMKWQRRYPLLFPLAKIARRLRLACKLL